jgi:dipeptidase E
MNQKKIFLAGGGDAQLAKEIDNLYGSVVGQNAKVLYIPIAFECNDSYVSCLKWFENTYKRFGFKTEMLVDLKGLDIEYLKKFDSIYIGGGNTFSLLHDIKYSGFYKTLKDFIALGKVVYGGSAGAIILGKDIGTSRLGTYPDENSIGLLDFTGLDVVNGFSLHCHYKKDDYPNVEQFSKEHSLNILALTEQGGVYINGNDFIYIGEVESFLSKD